MNKGWSRVKKSGGDGRLIGFFSENRKVVLIVLEEVLDEAETRVKSIGQNGAGRGNRRRRRRARDRSVRGGLEPRAASASSTGGSVRGMLVFSSYYIVYHWMPTASMSDTRRLRKYSMCFWSNASSAPEERYSAYFNMKTPQSQPFIWRGMSFG